MNSKDHIDRVIASLLEAQLDESIWPTASALFDDACGLLGNHLAVIRGNSHEDAEFLFGKLYKKGEPDDELEQLYINDYFRIDERLPRYFHLEDSKLVHVSKLFTERELKVSPTYNDFIVPTGAGNSLNVHMVGAHNVHIVMLLVRSGSVSQWTTEQITTLRHLLPYIRHFINVRQALIDATISPVQTIADSLSSKRIGIILLDGTSRIVEANGRALEILAAENGLTDRGGYLTPRYAADISMFNGLFSDASSSKLKGGTMSVRRPDGTSLTLHITPLRATAHFDSNIPLGVSVVVLLVDPLDSPSIDADRAMAAFDLTPAQARVIAALAAGGTVRHIAESTFRSEAAVRWHIKKMMAQFGFSSQSELVRLVLTTPGIFDPK